jgi:hypothetical protein
VPGPVAARLRHRAVLARKTGHRVGPGPPSRHDARPGTKSHRACIVPGQIELVSG